MSRWRGRLGRGRPRLHRFSVQKDRADMRRLAPITFLARSELTSAFHGAIQGLWTPRSPTDFCALRLPLPLPLGLPLPLPPGVPLETSRKRPFCPPQRAMWGLGFGRHLCVTCKSVDRLGASLSSPLGPRTPRTRRLRHLLRAGCSASARTARASTWRRSVRRDQPREGASGGFVRRPPVRSPVRPPHALAGGRVLASVAPFAGFRFCRHIYVTQRSVRKFGAPSLSACVDTARRAPCTRRLRYRLRAGSAALSRPNRASIDSRRFVRGADRAGDRCRCQVDATVARRGDVRAAGRARRG
jgi:hypothetical protein